MASTVSPRGPVSAKSSTATDLLYAVIILLFLGVVVGGMIFALPRLLARNEHPLPAPRPVLKSEEQAMDTAAAPDGKSCTTCHVNILQPGLEQEVQPYRTHSRLDLFLSRASPHPVSKFHCADCHGGTEGGSDFAEAGHAPSTSEQRRSWEKKYSWRAATDGKAAMMPLPLVEAGCFNCHAGQLDVPGADRLNAGLQLIDRAGCYVCHFDDRYAGRVPPGPGLERVADKLTPEWVWRWLENPRAFPNHTWMPALFNQNNRGEKTSVARRDQEIQAVVHTLFARNWNVGLDPAPIPGNSTNGEELVWSLGCLGCHQMGKENSPASLSPEALRRRHGPNLLGLGGKTTGRWLYNWLKNPQRFDPATRMPDFRLSDQEAADIAAFLVQDQPDMVLTNRLPEADETVLNEMTLEFLTVEYPTNDAAARLTGMTPDEKREYAGAQIIRRIGCAQCHHIPGFDREKSTGPDLAALGDRLREHPDVRAAGIDHLNYGFTDPELEAIATALAGLASRRLTEAPDPSIAPMRKIFAEEGRALVREFNCQACHVMEGEGGVVREAVVKWLVRYQDQNPEETDVLAAGYLPPDLTGEGRKVKALWLFDYLHQPHAIRPWLKVRMPTFGFQTNQILALVNYFSDRDDQEVSFDEPAPAPADPSDVEAGAQLFSADYFSCASCHAAGTRASEIGPESRAPNYGMARNRLKPAWILEWIRNPQALQPGTRMPSFFDSQYFDDSGPEDILNGDEERQIRALRDYLLSLPDKNQNPPPESPIQPEEPPDPSKS